MGPGDWDGGRASRAAHDSWRDGGGAAFHRVLGALPRWRGCAPPGPRVGVCGSDRAASLGPRSR